MSDEPKLMKIGGRTYNRRHGTRSGYRAGCRCDPCVESNRVYQREWVAAKRAAAKKGKSA